MVSKLQMSGQKVEAHARAQEKVITLVVNWQRLLSLDMFPALVLPHFPFFLSVISIFFSLVLILWSSSYFYIFMCFFLFSTSSLCSFIAKAVYIELYSKAQAGKKVTTSTVIKTGTVALNELVTLKAPSGGLYTSMFQMVVNLYQSFVCSGISDGDNKTQ